MRHAVPTHCALQQARIGLGEVAARVVEPGRTNVIAKALILRNTLEMVVGLDELTARRCVVECRAKQIPRTAASKAHYRANSKDAEQGDTRRLPGRRTNHRRSLTTSLDCGLGREWPRVKLGQRPV